MTATYSLSDLLDRFRDFHRDTTAPMPTDLYLGLWNAVGRLADLEGLGEKVWWCETHKGLQGECEWKSLPYDACELVEKLLIPTQQRGSE